MKKKLFAGMAVGLFMMGIAGTEANASTLIGHWDFEEGSGASAFDTSGNSLNGAISNATYTTGKVGNYALDFNGSNSFVQVSYSALLNPDSISISLWFKPGATQLTHADLLDKGHGSGTNPYYGGYVLQYAGDSSTIGVGYGNGSGFPGLNTGGSYKDGQWHHMVANLGAAEIALYIDGQLIDKIAGQGPILDNDSDLFFGRHRTLGRYFNGALDDIRIYDGPLSATEVSRLYQPVPLPGAILLLGTGLVGLVGGKRRKNRQG